MIEKKVVENKKKEKVIELDSSTVWLWSIPQGHALSTKENESNKKNSSLRLASLPIVLGIFSLAGLLNRRLQKT